MLEQSIQSILSLAVSNILSFQMQVETTGVGLDFEKRKTHTLIIKASDDVPGASTERSASCTVVITVTDINDNAPLCIQPLPVIMPL